MLIGFLPSNLSNVNSLSLSFLFTLYIFVSLSNCVETRFEQLLWGILCIEIHNSLLRVRLCSLKCIQFSLVDLILREYCVPEILLRHCSSSHSPDIHGHLIDFQEILSITEISYPFLAEQLNAFDDQISTSSFLLGYFFVNKLLERNPIDGFLRFPVAIEFRVNLLLVEEEILADNIRVKSQR